MWQYYMEFLNKKNEIVYSIDFYYIIILTWSDYCQQLVDFQAQFIAALQFLLSVFLLTCNEGGMEKDNCTSVYPFGTID